MKQSYAVPTVIRCGDVVTETKAPQVGPPEPIHLGAAVGNVGFFL